MAENRESRKPVEYQSESGEELKLDEVSSEESCSQDSESEAELTPVSKKATSSPLQTYEEVQTLSGAKPKQREASSSEEEGENLASESELWSDGSETQKSNIDATKPMSKFSASEPVTLANGITVSKTANKRAANYTDNEGDRAFKWLVVSSSCGWSIEDRIMAAGAKLFETGKGLEGELQWKKLKVEEAEINIGKMDVKIAQARLILDFMKSGEY